MCLVPVFILSCQSSSQVQKMVSCKCMFIPVLTVTKWIFKSGRALHYNWSFPRIFNIFISVDYLNYKRVKGYHHHSNVFWLSYLNKRTSRSPREKLKKPLLWSLKPGVRFRFCHFMVCFEQIMNWEQTYLPHRIVVKVWEEITCIKHLAHSRHCSQEILLLVHI